MKAYFLRAFLMLTIFSSVHGQELMYTLLGKLQTSLVRLQSNLADLRVSLSKLKDNLCLKKKPSEIEKILFDDKEVWRLNEIEHLKNQELEKPVMNKMISNLYLYARAGVMERLLEDNENAKKRYKKLWDNVRDAESVEAESISKEELNNFEESKLQGLAEHYKQDAHLIIKCFKNMDFFAVVSKDVLGDDITSFEIILHNPQAHDYFKNIARICQKILSYDYSIIDYSLRYNQRQGNILKDRWKELSYCLLKEDSFIVDIRICFLFNMTGLTQHNQSSLVMV